MRPLYRLGALGYRVAVAAAQAFNDKARRRELGARQALSVLPATSPGRACYWMHCASVGEYEQGRPLWDAMRASAPEARFVLSFFSPSGYEQFGGKPGHGEVVYLPHDVGDTARQFVSRLYGAQGVRGLAVFVKYEWWLGYHEALRSAGVPYVVIAAAFRQSQPFFRWWGGAWREALRSARHVFTQTPEAAGLLGTLDIEHVSAVGDPRVDRTRANASAPLDRPQLEAWARGQSLLLVAGSTWPAGEALLAEVLAAAPHVSLLIAPHEVHEAHLAAVERQFARAGCTRLSRLTRGEAPGRVVLVDSIGLLSRLYRLGHVAYVGGGFGAGIHNVLEAVAYGLPTAVGPKHGTFAEVGELIGLGVASEVRDAAQLALFLERHAAPEARHAVFAKAEAYFEAHAGATARIVSYLRAAKLLPA